MVLLRQTAARLMLGGGADIGHIQAFLGYENLEGTQLYSRVSNAHLQQVHGQSHGCRVKA